MPNDSLQRDIIGRIFASHKNSFSLRMAPMIDMIFLLLIFFLVASKWRPAENFLPFQLPAAQAQDVQFGKAEPLQIYIRAIPNGCKVQIAYFPSIRIEQETLEENLGQLIKQIKQCLTNQKRFTSDPIEIICGPDVKWDYLAKIYNLLFGIGLSDITFQMTERL